MANLLATADSRLVLDGADNVWRGEVETVQRVPVGGIHAVPVPQGKPRLGGRWLALVIGYDVRLNTATETAALLESVQALRSTRRGGG
jgi:hypothetical protein